MPDARVKRVVDVKKVWAGVRALLCVLLIIFVIFMEFFRGSSNVGTINITSQNGSTPCAFYRAFGDSPYILLMCKQEASYYLEERKSNAPTLVVGGRRGMREAANISDMSASADDGGNH